MENDEKLIEDGWKPISSYSEPTGERYTVGVSKYKHMIRVCIYDGVWRMEPTHYVKPPGFIGRLLGRTFEEKVQRKVAQVQKHADKLNAADREVSRVLEVTTE